MTSQRALMGAERSLFGAATLLSCVYVIVTLHGVLAADLALRQFDTSQSTPNQVASDTAAGEFPDFTLWDPRRIEAYRRTLLQTISPPLAVLTSDRLRGRVPIFEGTDELVLNRGAGWIAGTAKPGETGNVGVAGHRDGVFRGLKDVVRGDRLTVMTPERAFTYAVDDIVIVTPRDVYVLDPRERPSLTLITCYPFYFVGNAPQRYVVHASLIDAPQHASLGSITHVPQVDSEDIR
jgi:sortase A